MERCFYVRNTKPGSEDGLWWPEFSVWGNVSWRGDKTPKQPMKLLLWWLKSLPTFRELQLLGKATGTGEAKVSTWQRSWASVLHALARPKTLSKAGTGVQERAQELSGHGHSQQGTAEHRNDSLGSCWVPLRDPDLLAFPVPPSSPQCEMNLPNSHCTV